MSSGGTPYVVQGGFQDQERTSSYASARRARPRGGRSTIASRQASRRRRRRTRQDRPLATRPGPRKPSHSRASDSLGLLSADSDAVEEVRLTRAGHGSGAETRERTRSAGTRQCVVILVSSRWMDSVIGSDAREPAVVRAKAAPDHRLETELHVDLERRGPNARFHHRRPNAYRGHLDREYRSGSSSTHFVVKCRCTVWQRPSPSEGRYNYSSAKGV